MVPLALSCASRSFCMTIAWSGKGYGGSPQYSSTWNGSTASRASRIPGATFSADDDTGGLSALSCPSTTYCMALGLGGESTRSFVWHAGKWRTVPIERPLPVSPAPPPTQSEPGPSGWSSVACLTPTSCLALGVRRVSVFKRTGDVEDVAATFDRWNGRKWTRIETIQGLNVQSLACASAHKCMAVGTESAVWNGVSWKVGRVPGETKPTSYTAQYVGVWCSSAFTCLAVGTKTPSGESLAAAAEWSNGVWSVLTTPGVVDYNFALSGISCVDVTNCVVEGTLDTQTARPYAFSYDGASWTETKVAGSTPGEGTIAATSGTTALMVDRPAAADETYWMSER